MKRINSKRIKFQKLQYSRVEGTKTETLHSFYHNFYSFYKNKMGIILKHSLPYSPYIIYILLSFSVLIYHFFSIFQMHRKWYKNGLGYKNVHLENNHTKCSKLIFICSIHKYTCEFQHLNTLREPTEDILYFVSTFRRVRWILRNLKNAKNVFVFGGSLFNAGFRVAIFIGVCFALHIGVVLFIFRFLFCIFVYYPFFYHCTICT